MAYFNCTSPTSSQISSTATRPRPWCVNADGFLCPRAIYHPKGEDAKGLPGVETIVSLIVQQHRLPLTSSRDLVSRGIFRSDLPVHKDLKPSTKLRLSFGPGRSPSCRQNLWRVPRIDCKTKQLFHTRLFPLLAPHS
jgi:hypothetical protein